ncbi:hypothetical protein [Pseudodesulfovibrio portus]|uniref:Uncharacterized protein n=1 Tax=Pseudodesulfovibrio portus TaxID=231439 RepID=A0ABM8AMZ9_9BACT|nr:hypothetical protein [Pseudodesulfovibrio portus]BDQ32768.1 hypothetical protein JCM14722_03100 [Pseudodesulfovibrio portus]
MRSKEFLVNARAIVLMAAAVIILSPVAVMAYGGSEGTGSNSGIGASISSSAAPSYFSWSDGITDHASYEAAETRAYEAERAETGPYGYTDRYTEEYYDGVHAGLAISRAAWDETVEVLPSVRRFAVILEQMMMSGTISPRQAFNLLAVYNLTRQRQLGL